MAKIPTRVSERLKKEIAVFQKVLAKAKDRDVNESDTVIIITAMLERVFGFDKFTELTSEQAMKGTFCDLLIKLDGKTKFILEVKAIGLTLKENHLRQAVGYGSTNGIPWVVLTNGIDWEIYKIRFEKPVNHDLVCSFNFSELNTRKQEDFDKVFLLCKEGIEKSAIDEFHDHVQSVNRLIISAIVQSDPVVSVVRRELRKLADGVRVSGEEIKGILTNEVFKRDVIQGEQAADAMNRLKKAHKKQAKRKQCPKTPPTAVPQDESAAE
jgi:hypothetical protein